MQAEIHFFFASSMLKSPLAVLRKGLNVLEKHVSARKSKLQALLQWNEKLSTVDEEWLDRDGNLVDEQRVLDTLEAASDYDRALDELNSGDKGLVLKLRELAGDVSKVVGMKQKSMLYSSQYLLKECLHQLGSKQLSTIWCKPVPFNT